MASNSGLVANAAPSAVKTLDRIREPAREGAEKQARTARDEVGDIIVDATGEYFPEKVRARRRRDMARGFALGLGLGVVLSYVTRR